VNDWWERPFWVMVGALLMMLMQEHVDEKRKEYDVDETP